MSAEMMIDLLVAALIVVGGAFAAIGSWGLVRLPTIMERLHGPTKATTLGLGALLLASVLFFRFSEGIGTAHELLITLFLFITAPISANMVAKVHLHQSRMRIDGERDGPAGPPPPPGDGPLWSTFVEHDHGDDPTVGESHASRRAAD